MVDLTGASAGPSTSSPLCLCGERAVCRVVQRAGPNLGKDYYTCPRLHGGASRRCEFFMWAADTAPADRSLFLGGPKRGEAGGGGGAAGAAAEVEAQAGAGARAAARGDAAAAAVGASGGAPPAKRPCLFVSTLSMQLASVQSLFTILSPGVPAELVAQFRALPGAQTSPGEQLGSLRLEVPLPALSSFTALATRRGLRVDAPPPWLLGGLHEWNQAEAAHTARGEAPLTGPGLAAVLPPFLDKALMSFQRIGVEFALSRRGRVLIGDEMGLGKTVQALAVALVYKADWPLLVVCPSSLRLNWREELVKWLGTEVPADDVRVIMKGADADLGGLAMPPVTIASYELVAKVPPWQLSEVGVVICDESHYLKNRAAKRTKFVCGQLLQNTKRVLLLTGTPAMSRPSDLYPQLSALVPKLFGTWYNFTERYCAARQAAYGWDTSGSSNLAELHTLLCDTVLIRRLKKDVLTQLLPKQRSLIYIETAPALMKHVERAMAEQSRAALALRSATTAGQAASLELVVKAATTKLETASCEAKIRGVCAYVKELLDASPGLKFLLFAHHQAMLNKLEAFFREKLKVDLIRIDGGTPQGKRQALTERFQTDANCQVALLGITAAGVGLTLTAAHTVVFAELWWTPGSLIQAEDRVHRIGQKNSVDVRYLLAKHTVDEQMWSIVGRKLNVVGRSLDGAAARMDAKAHADNDELIVRCRGVLDNEEGSGGSADEVDSAASGRGRSTGWDASPDAYGLAAGAPQRTRKGYMTLERGFANAARRQADGEGAGRGRPPHDRRRGGGGEDMAPPPAGAGAAVAVCDLDSDGDTVGGVAAATIFPEAVLAQLDSRRHPPPPAAPLQPQPPSGERRLPLLGGGLAAGGRLVDADEAMVLRLQAAREAMATASVTDGTDGVLFLE